MFLNSLFRRSTVSSPRLILHVGTHKTGTTSVQKFLAEHRRELLRQGLDYPTGPRVFGASKAPHHKFAHDLVGDVPGAIKTAEAFIASARKSAAKGRTILISSEPIYRHVTGTRNGWQLDRSEFWQRRRRYLEALASVISDFDVEILIYLRRRDEAAISLYNEALRSSTSVTGFEDFLESHEPWFDYDRQITLFQEIFRKVRIESYEEAARAGLVRSFFNSVGFSFPDGAEEVWIRRSETPTDWFGSEMARAEFLKKYEQHHD